MQGFKAVEAKYPQLGDIEVIAESSNEGDERCGVVVGWDEPSDGGGARTCTRATLTRVSSLRLILGRGRLQGQFSSLPRVYRVREDTRFGTSTHAPAIPHFALNRADRGMM